MLKAAIFLLLFLILSPNNAFAQGNESAKPDNPDFNNLRDLMMDEIMDKMMAERQEAMQEALYKTYEAYESEEKDKFFFDPVSRSLSRNYAVRTQKSGAGFLSLRNTRNALGLNFEMENEKRKIASSNLPTKRSRSLLEEVLETDFKGSIYHPNLVSFDIGLENGLRQSREKFQPNLTGKLKNSSVNRFHILSSFLRKKPYAFSLSADKSREVENREFFERQTVDSTRYAGNFGFRNKFLPAGFSFSNTSKDIDRISRPSQHFQDDELSFNLAHESQITGQTSFEATQDKFSRQESDIPEQEGTSRDFNLSNLKTSSDNKKTLYSYLSSYDLTGSSQSKSLNLNENLNIEHTDYLNSSYSYNFSDRSSSGVKTRDNRVSANVRHKLYESLISSFSPYYFKSKSNVTSQDSYGSSWDEDYTKKLGLIGRLNLGVGITYANEKRKNSDTVISVVDESQTLTTGTVTLLDNPQVDTQTVVVTDLTGTITYVLNIDYQLSSLGESTQIQRVPGGAIADGQGVLVDYQAKGTPNLEFSTLGQSFRGRIDFLEDLIGVFYRLNKERHPKVSGQDDLILQTLTDTVMGIDFHYKNLTIEFEDEDFDSNLSPYKRMRLAESLFFNPTQNSTLTLQSSQTRVRLLDTQNTQKFFDYISRYSLGLNRYSRFNLEAGFRWQEGLGIDLNDLIAGAGYELNYGKLMLNIKYDFKKQIFLGDRLINHFLFLKVKRTF